MLTVRCPCQIPLLRVRCRPHIRYVLGRVRPTTEVASNRSLPQTRHILRIVCPDGSAIIPPYPQWYSSSGARSGAPSVPLFFLLQWYCLLATASNACTLCDRRSVACMVWNRTGFLWGRPVLYTRASSACAQLLRATPILSAYFTPHWFKCPTQFRKYFGCRREVRPTRKITRYFPMHRSKCGHGHRKYG